MNVLPIFLSLLCVPFYEIFIHFFPSLRSSKTVVKQKIVAAKSNDKFKKRASPVPLSGSDPVADKLKLGQCYRKLLPATKATFRPLPGHVESGHFLDVQYSYLAFRCLV